MKRFKRKPDPLIEWLVTRPGVAVPEGPGPRTIRGLYYLHGGKAPLARSTRDVALRLSWWESFRGTAMDDLHFGPPPSQWPARIQEALDACGVGHVTPAMWRRCMSPEGGEDWRQANAMARISHLGVLSAHAYGYKNHSGRDLRRATEAVQEISRHVGFLVWACNPMLEMVPLPASSTQAPLSVRRSARHTLTTNPLSAGDSTSRLGIAAPFRYPERILGLPRHPWTPRTTRFNYIDPSETHE